LTRFGFVFAAGVVSPPPSLGVVDAGTAEGVMLGAGEAPPPPAVLGEGVETGVVTGVATGARAPASALSASANSLLWPPAVAVTMIKAVEIPDDAISARKRVPLMLARKVTVRP
jgi:hypothetical protein